MKKKLGATPGCGACARDEKTRKEDHLPRCYMRFAPFFRKSGVEKTVTRESQKKRPTIGPSMKSEFGSTPGCQACNGKSKNNHTDACYLRFFNLLKGKIRREKRRKPKTPTTSRKYTDDGKRKQMSGAQKRKRAAQKGLCIEIIKRHTKRSKKMAQKTTQKTFDAENDTKKDAENDTEDCTENNTKRVRRRWRAGTLTETPKTGALFSPTAKPKASLGSRPDDVTSEEKTLLGTLLECYATPCHP